MSNNNNTKYDSENKAISKWISRLSKESLPLFAHTAKNIASIATDSKSSVSEMSQVILSDSTMTARVLRMANSVHFNPGATAINTVSRAIVLLGSDSVKNIALSISLIDTLLTGMRHERAVEELVQGYHAAIQAKGIAELQNLSNKEEIFIAALLQRIGHLTFWCFPYGQAELLDFEYSMTHDDEEAEKAVLGFSLSKLTEHIVQKWHLGELLEKFTHPTAQENPSRLSVKYGYEIAVTIKQGWANEQTQATFKKIEKLVNRPISEIQTIIYQQSQTAINELTTLGLHKPEKLIPKWDALLNTEEDNSHTEDPNPKSIDTTIDIQLVILREISSMVFQGADINVILNTVLEGIYRGLEMDRIVFAIIHPSSMSLKAKLVLGSHQEILMERFNFALTSKKENMITDIFQSGKPAIIHQKLRYQKENLITDDIKQCIGDNDAYVMPIFINNNPKALIYADRCTTKKPLCENEFQVFIHFCEHINIAFKMLNKK